MKTPKEYTNNLKKGIVTPDMLGACTYSVNKRAKNYRDSLRENYDRLHTCGYGLRKYIKRTIDDLEDTKKEYYSMKDFLLSQQQPICIHRHVRMKATHCRDLEDEVYSPVEEFFLLYQIGEYTFHHPIKKEDVESYHLPVEELPANFETFGADTDDLLSVPFCRKVISGLKTNTLRLAA